MAHVRLLDKEGKQVTENTNVRLEKTGSLSLPREITHNGLLYRWESREGTVNIYKQSDV